LNVATDFFLKLGDVKGESTDEGHPDEIELASWSWAASNPPSIGSGTGGAGTGRVSLAEINCTATMSKASPFLFEYCANGKHFDTAKLTCRKAGGTKQEDFLVIDLEEVYIAHYQTSGSTGGDIPYDNFSLAYGKITFDSLAQSKEGTTSSAGKKSWDLRANKGG